MKFVLRTLKKNAAEKTKKINGVIHYEFPLIMKDKEGIMKTHHIYIPKTKTYFSSSTNTLCVCLESESTICDITLKEDPNTKLSDSRVLKLLSNDYIAYMASNKYDTRLPHAMNTFIPIGIQEYNEETDEVILNKWSSACSTIADIYGKDLTCIEPFSCNSLYPFHYKKFTTGEFIREYRSNVMMFVLCMDKNFVLTSEKKFDDYSYIYYKLKDRYYPFFRMLTDEQFYESCLVKDVRNHKKTPFLKSFNDQGLCRELIEFIKEDAIYKSTVVAKYKEIRDEMKLTNKDKEKYFIPSLGHDLVEILRKIKTNKKVTPSELALYKKAYQERIVYLSENYFDKSKKFFFTYDDIQEENFVINSLLKNYIDNSNQFAGYDADSKVIYTYDENSRGAKPMLEVVTKEELDKIKDEVYNYWISTKYYKK